MGAGLVASGGCSVSITPWLSGQKKRTGLSDRPLRLAMIGVGGAGRSHFEYLCKSGERVVALCDVDSQELSNAREMTSVKFPDVQSFQDFRVMFDNVRNLDAVVIATPDHGHGMQAVRALREGCHVYLETPLTHTLAELHVLEYEAGKAERLVLSGDLQCTHKMALRAFEALESGVTGEIRQVHLWTNRPVWPQGASMPVGSDPVPETLAWDLWLAGARPRSFKRFVYHKFNWRGWSDFGAGALGDIGCQMLSFPFKALALQAPLSVERIFADGGSPAAYPKASELKFICKSERQKANVELFWYDGNRMPNSDIVKQVQATLGRVPGTGVLLVGERGSWFVSGSGCKQHYIGLNGASRMTDFEKHDLWLSSKKVVARYENYHQLFLGAVRSGKAYDFNKTAGIALHKAVLSGAIAQRVGGKLEWENRKWRFADAGGANEMLAPSLQPGWKYFDQ